MDQFTAAFELAREEQSSFFELAETFPSYLLDEDEDLVGSTGFCTGCKNLAYTTDWICMAKAVVEIIEGVPIIQYGHIDPTAEDCDLHERPKPPSWLAA